MTRFRRPAILVPAALLAGILLAGALAAFQPWKLVLSTTVDEASPLTASSPAPSLGPAGASPGTTTASAPPTSAAPSPTSPPAATPPGPAVLARGEFISHEHATTGRAVVIALADGRRVLRLEGLDTSNGPDLKVWLAEAPVIDGTDGWFVFDDAAYVDLGPLKGNKGNQNYPIPAEVDIGALSSVTIWCDRFSVSFGAAALVAA